MNADGVKLTTYFGERARANGGFLADALLDCYERHGFQPASCSAACSGSESTTTCAPTGS